MAPTKRSKESTCGSRLNDHIILDAETLGSLADSTDSARPLFLAYKVLKWSKVIDFLHRIGIKTLAELFSVSTGCLLFGRSGDKGNCKTEGR